MKKYLLGGLIVLLLAGGLFYWFKPSSTRRDVLSVVPGDAVFVFQTERFTDTWEEIHELNIWHHLIHTPGFEDWQELDSLMTRYLLQNDLLGSLFKNRPTLMSVHPLPQDDFSLLYAVDLKSIKNIRKLTGWLSSFKSKNFRVIPHKTDRYTYYILSGLDEPFYFAFIDNLAVGSFDDALLKRCLQGDKNAHASWKQKIPFVEKELPGGLVRWWVNYKSLPAFMQIYFDQADTYLGPLSRQLILTATDINHSGERLTAEGLTLTDSVPSYFTALLDVKPGEPRTYEIASRRTAMYISQSFKSFNMYHQSLLDAYGEKDKKLKNNYLQSVKKIERYFKIDLQEDFFDWIGQEIALIKLRLYKPQKAEELILLIQTRDRKAAQRGMNKISEQIRKKSPFKFKKYSYKNFEINYLHQKNFFKTLLGDLFKGIDKPYYTFIQDYVVFSNSEEELKNFIDDYIMGNTLSHDDDFMDFKKNWNEKSHILIYLHMPKLYALVQKMLTGEGRKSWEEKKDFLLSMHRMMLQFTGNGEWFDTKMIVDHNPEARAREEAEALAYQIDENVHNRYYEDLQFKIFFPDTADVKDGPYKVYYENGKIKIEGSVKKGQPHGFWRTYYPSGNLQSVVFYDNGEVHGDAFFYYDSRPPVKMAEMHFDHDLLDGLYREYYRNGAIKAEIEYKNGKPHGKARYYYPSGKLKAEGKFKKGKKKGKWIFYDQTGKIIRKEKY